MTNNNEIKILETFFDNNIWPADINRNKLWERASISEEEYKDGWVIVEIERHTAIMEDQYRKGLPMNAFQTYSMRYAVDLKSGMVEELPRKEESIEIDIEGLVDEHLSSERFSLDIESIENRKYLISENVSKSEAVITTLEEAKSWGIELTRGFVDYFREMLSMYQKDSKSTRDLIQEYKACCEKEVIYEIEKLWNNKE